MPLKISVVLSSYNYARFIGAAIDSILAQTFPAHEIIVVDDGSSDDSISIIESYGERVRLIQQANQGVCVARNKGAKLATGDIIAFFDSDDIWRPRKLEMQVEAFEVDEKVGLVSCGLRGFDPNGKTVYENVVGKSGWRANEIILFKPVINFSASAIAVRRDIFEKLEGFDERRELYAAEDREFCYRVAKISKITFIPDILLDYRIHGDNGHLNISRMEKATVIALDKIFAQGDDEIEPLRREAYGSLYLTMAGSHFQMGNYYSFLKSTFKTLWFHPAKARYFAGLPIRLIKRKLGNSQSASE